MKKTGIFLFLIYFVYSNSLLAQNVKTEAPYLFSKLPQLKNFVTLKELYRIPLDDESGKNQYYIQETWGMDADSANNLYIPDYWNCTVTVFDKNGKYVRTMFGKGQGPGELLLPNNISILHNKMYIYESNRGIKVFNLQGRYIDFFVISQGFHRLFRAFDNYLLTVDIKIYPIYPEDQRGNFLDLYSNEGKKIRNIAVIKTEDNTYSSSWAFSVDSKNRIYYPDSRDEYKINVFSVEGKLLYSFGREYKRVPFSDGLLAFLKKRKVDDMAKKLKYPQVMFMILSDKNGYIWVVVGECTMYNDAEYKIESVIDIFNENGEFLYTFKSPYFVYYSFIKNGRLYSRNTKDDLNIRVFEIQYNK
jgi:hypothetical protein